MRGVGSTHICHHNAQLFSGAGIVVLAHVRSVAQLLYLRYGVLIQAPIVITLHAKFEGQSISARELWIERLQLKLTALALLQ
jgi:hypothetical protein